MNYPINDAGIELLKARETFVGHAYPDPYSDLGKELRRRGLWAKVLRDPANIPVALDDQLSGKPWTIGWGFTQNVQPGDTMTLAEGDKRLAAELAPLVARIKALCPGTNENELAAFTVCAWNIGIGGFAGSTMVKAWSRGDKQSVARAFGLWNKAKGEVVAGLTARRLAEAALFMEPPQHDIETMSAVMPQAVEPEKPLTQSPIITTTTLTAGAGVLATASQASQSVKDIRESLGDYFVPSVLGIILAGGGYVIWNRVKQRREGWA